MKIQEQTGRMGVGLALLAALCVGAPASAQRGGRPGGGNGNLEHDIHERPTPQTSFEASRIDGLPRRAGSGSLGHDVVISHRRRPIRDAGTVEAEFPAALLELSVEVAPYSGPDPLRAKPSHKKRSLRLAGGKVGDAGVIVLSLDPPQEGKDSLRAAGSIVIAGFFGEDGSFVVELPQEPEESAGLALYAQGANLSSRMRSAVVNLGD